MYSESDIDGAVAAGALSPQAAAALRAHVAETHAAPAVDEEHFRLLTGFNDIFVAIAIVLSLVALGWIGGSIAAAVGALAIAAASWLLAEYFTRIRRMALPSILLLIAFVGAAAAVVPAAVVGGTHDFVSARTGALVFAGGSLIGVAAAALHWWRFHVPITIAAGGAALVALVLALVTAAIPDLPGWFMNLLVLIGGGALFAFAMRWDLSDRQRLTRRADIAFWLHLTAAPMIAHGLFRLLGVFSGELEGWRALVAVALYVLFGIVALAVDRRALLVSSLVYVLFALGSLFRQAGAVELAAALTAFVIGASLLTLSAFWQPMRRTVVGWFGAWAGRLPPTAQPLATGASA